MPYDYLKDGVTSDITFHATGRTLDELFTAAADATTNAMVADLETVRPSVDRSAVLTDDSLDLLLMRFLDEIVFHKDAAGLLLRAADVHVENVDGSHRVRVRLQGESIDPSRHDLRADVKAVTLHGLSVERLASGWRAEVTLDV
jgi:SHS2 domain-containing protein